MNNNIVRNVLLVLILTSIGCTKSKPPVPNKDTSSPQSDQDGAVVINKNSNTTDTDLEQPDDSTDEVTSPPLTNPISSRDPIIRSGEIPDTEGLKPISGDNFNVDTHQSDRKANVIESTPIDLNPEIVPDIEAPENRTSHLDQIQIIDVIQDQQYIDPRDCGQDHTSPWCDYQFVTLKAYHHNTLRSYYHNILLKCYIIEDIFTNQDGTWINSSCQFIGAETNGIDMTEQMLMIKADLHQDGELHRHTQKEIDCTNTSYNPECERLYQDIERYCEYKSIDWCTLNGLNVSTYIDYTRSISIASAIDFTPRRQYDRLPTWEQVPITANELFDFLEANQNKTRVLIDRERLLWTIKRLSTTNDNGYLWLYELNRELKNLTQLLEDFVRDADDSWITWLDSLYGDPKDSWLTQANRWWDSRNIQDHKDRIMYIIHLAETGDFRYESPY